MSKSLAIIIPVRQNGDPYVTLESLGRSTFQDFSVTIFQDTFGNANKARNAGFRLAPPSEFALFSDDDIRWEPDGIGAMVEALDDRKACYSYGSYEMGGKLYCATVPWDADELRKRNLSSTMSVIRRECLPYGPFDETLERLQDWELFLRMTKELSCVGLHCEHLIFRTDVRDGITRNGKQSYQEAFAILKEKHKL